MILELLRLEVARLGLDDVGGKFQHVLWNCFVTEWKYSPQRNPEKAFAARFECDDMLARGENDPPERYHAFFADRLPNDRERLCRFKWSGQKSSAFETDYLRARDQLTQQLQPLRPECVDQKSHSRDIAARAVETGNETELDRISADRKNNRSG